MKRKFIILLTMLSLSVLSACDETDEEGLLPPTTTLPPEDDLIPDIENPDLDEDTLSFFEELFNQIDIEDTVSDDFTLESSVEDVELEWKSYGDSIVIDDETAIVIQDVVDQNVVLEATALHNDIEYKKRFDVIVEKIVMGSPSTYTALEVMDYISAKLVHENFYYKEQLGTSSGTASGTQCAQSISNKVYKFDSDYFLETESITTKSLFNISADIFHKAYFDNVNVAYNHSSSKISDTATPTASSESGYENKFGLLTNSKNFTGYVITEDTLNSSKYEAIGNDHSFYYNLNTSTSCQSMKVQMQEYGGITNLSFSSIELTMVVDSDWNIKYIDSKEVYEAKKGYSTIKMTQELHTTFTKFNLENPVIEIPNYLMYKETLESLYQ